MRTTVHLFAVNRGEDVDDRRTPVRARHEERPLARRPSLHRAIRATERSFQRCFRKLLRPHLSASRLAGPSREPAWLAHGLYMSDGVICRYQ